MVTKTLNILCGKGIQVHFSFACMVLVLRGDCFCVICMKTTVDCLVRIMIYALCLHLWLLIRSRRNVWLHYSYDVVWYCLLRKVKVSVIMYPNCVLYSVILSLGNPNIPQ
jgi:hypothetical protein